MNIDDVIKAYVALRDGVEKVRTRHKEELSPYYEKMVKIEAWLQDQLQTQGLKNFKGTSGTAYLQEETSVTVADWEATLDYIRENEMWELLERRVSKSVVADHLESHDSVPPGVDMKRSTVVRVRRG